jgi:protein Mpv17
VIHFVTYAILNTPINCVWQDLLEGWFPSSTPAAAEKPVKGQSEKPVVKKQGLNVTNTLAKFALDQSIGALINIPLFIGIMGMLKGQSVDQIINTVQEVRLLLLHHVVNTNLTIVSQDFMDIYISGAKLWPAVSLVSFVAIPANRRVIFGSAAGVVWNIYLSFKAR